MANMHGDQPTNIDYQRQDEIDEIKARYEYEYHTGKSPKMADYIQRYPQFARELMEFAFFFHTIGAEQEEPDLASATQFTPAEQRARARIRELSAPTFSIQLKSIITQGRLAGYMAPKLAEMLELSLDILTKLDAHVIIEASIPRALIQRIADLLHVTPEVVTTYLGKRQTAQAGSFFYADESPQHRQESFLHAIQVSKVLSSEHKERWITIIEREHPAP